MTLPIISLAPLQDAPQTRAAAPFEVNIPAVFGRSITTNYRIPTVREALGVPAVYRAVSLISNAGGALTLGLQKKGMRVDPEDYPQTSWARMVRKPNPLTVPRSFWRDSFFYEASRGEFWWYVAQRDKDGYASVLFPVPPYEVKVEETNDPLRPRIIWRNRTMPNEDMVQVMLMPDPDNPRRGAGPLQLCGAAVSVAVEADEWAANFYSEGGYASIVLTPEVDFESEDDAQKVKDKWTSNPPNTPQIVSPGSTVTPLPVNEQGSQMLNSRIHNRGEVAMMFGIPGSLLEYVQSGSSLTYQNVGQRFTDFVRSCLWPNYLEGAEQALSDLLPRTWTTEFDTDRFERPDPKTRMEIHQLAIGSGIYDVEYAQKREGLDPASVEPEPVPQPTPPAQPAEPQPAVEARTQAPEVTEVRCDGMRTIKTAGIARLQPCNKLLAEAGPFVGTCPRCKKEHTA